MAKGRMLNRTWRDEQIRPGYVYMIFRSDGLIKIGYAANVKRRLSCLRYENRPRKLSVDSVIYAKHMGVMETFWHDIFDYYRKEGEWFDLPDLCVNMFRTCSYIYTEVEPVIEATAYDMAEVLVEYYGHVVMPMFDNLEGRYWKRYEENAVEAQSWQLFRKQVRRRLHG